MEGAATKDSYHDVTFTDEHGSVRTRKVPVVQELAREGVQNIPKVFARPPSDSITTAISWSPDDFPSVSLAKLRAMQLEERAKELQKLASGTREWGMVLLTDHGIPFSLISAVKDVVKAFFGLSLEEKRKSVGTYASTDNMGYGRTFINSENQILEWIDRLTMMAAPKEATDGLNVWPQNPSNFRETIESYAEETKRVGNEILEALAEALSLEKNAFVKYFDTEKSEIKVRINYYPPCPNPSSTLGLSPHTDPSVLSFLIQIDTSGGLQVMPKDKKTWVSVPWPVDALLVNVGDLLEIMSNGLVESAWHRAVAQADVHRYSVGLFYVPPSSTEIEPVKNDHADCKYKKVVVGEYVKQYSKVGVTPDKQAIKIAMV